MRTAHVGVIVGSILGLALVLEGFGPMLIVALIAAVGWAVSAAVSGDLDVAELVERTSTRRSDRTR